MALYDKDIHAAKFTNVKHQSEPKKTKFILNTYLFYVNLNNQLHSSY